MDTNIEELPEIESLEKDKEKLLEYFAYYDIVSLLDRIDALF
jgi:NADH:ubiquinone oxidoreductase subunit D